MGLKTSSLLTWRRRLVGGPEFEKMRIPYELRNVTIVATKVHMILHCFVVHHHSPPNYGGGSLDLVVWVPQSPLWRYHVRYFQGTSG